MNNDPNNLNSQQQQSSQSANPESTELEALRHELRELKEEVKNKQQIITSEDIATGVVKGIMRIIGTIIMLYFGFVFIAILYTAVVSSGDDNSSPPSVAR